MPVDQLSGTWTLVSLQPAQEAEQTPPQAGAYTLTLAGNRFSTTAECTSCSGTFVLTGGTMTTGPTMLCLAVNCAEQAFESRYKMLLVGNTTVTLSPTALELSSARGVLRFGR